jgi:hypothetical protein
MPVPQSGRVEATARQVALLSLHALLRAGAVDREVTAIMFYIRVKKWILKVVIQSDSIGTLSLCSRVGADSRQ